MAPFQHQPSWIIMKACGHWRRRSPPMPNCHVTCPTCSASLEIDAQYMGQTIQCPGCGSQFLARGLSQPVMPVRPVAQHAYSEERAAAPKGIKLLLSVMAILLLIICAGVSVLVYVFVKPEGKD